MRAPTPAADGGWTGGLRRAEGDGDRRRVEGAGGLQRLRAPEDCGRAEGAGGRRRAEG
jgi:hypothetical protein